MARDGPASGNSSDSRRGKDPRSHKSECKEVRPQETLLLMCPIDGWVQVIKHLHASDCTALRLPVDGDDPEHRKIPATPVSNDTNNVTTRQEPNETNVITFKRKHNMPSRCRLTITFPRVLGCVPTSSRPSLACHHQRDWALSIWLAQEHTEHNWHTNTASPRCLSLSVFNAPPGVRNPVNIHVTSYRCVFNADQASDGGNRRRHRDDPNQRPKIIQPSWSLSDHYTHRVHT